MAKPISENDPQRILGELRSVSPLPLTGFDVAETLNLPHSRAREVLEQLLKRGEVCQKETEKPSQARLYYVPEAEA